MQQRYLRILWAHERHLNDAAMLISTRTAKIKKQSMNRVKFGVNGKTPGVVLNMFAARVSGRYA